MPKPYYVRSTPTAHLSQSLNTDSQLPKGFYVFEGPGSPPTEIATILTLRPAYAFPAEIRGSAQLTPRSKFSSNGIVILNFRLKDFQEDMGDLGKILEPFARAFFPKENADLLIFEHITYDLEEDKLKHKRKVDKVARWLSTARWASITIAATHVIDIVLCQ